MRTLRIGKTRFAVLLVAICFAGCSSQKETEVHLVDGRSFTVKDFHNDGQFVSFASEGWEYTLPAMLLAKEKVEEPVNVQRINVSTNRITTHGRIFYGFDDMFVFLDMHAKKTWPIILVLEDVTHWPKDKQESFGDLFGTSKKRPYVGLEGHWVKD